MEQSELDLIKILNTNRAEEQGVYYKGIWREMVLKENSVSVDWAMSIFH